MLIFAFEFVQTISNMALQSLWRCEADVQRIQAKFVRNTDTSIVAVVKCTERFKTIGDFTFLETVATNPELSDLPPRLREKTHIFWFKGYRPLPPTPGKKIRGRRRGKDNWDIASAAVRLKDLWSDVGRKDRNAVRKDFSWNQVQHIRNWTISNWMMTNEDWKTEKFNWESKIGIGDDVRKGVEAWIAMSFESN